jgi:hypothetical protein
VHRHDHPERRVDVFELLTDDPEADVVHASAAVRLGHGGAEQAHLRHLRQHGRVEPMLPIQLTNARCDLAGAPLPDGALEQYLLLGEIEIDHLSGPRPVTPKREARRRTKKMNEVL